MPAIKNPKPAKTATKKSPAKKKTTAVKSAGKSSRAVRLTADGSANVEAYLAAVPPDQRAALQQLRKLIKSIAPAATECISYQIPTFKHHGGLVAFAAFKNHLSFFVMNLHTIKAHAAELEGFTTAPSGIHFTPEKPLPAGLVKKIVKERMAENESRQKARS